MHREKIWFCIKAEVSLRVCFRALAVCFAYANSCSEVYFHLFNIHCVSKMDIVFLFIIQHGFILLNTPIPVCTVWIQVDIYCHVTSNSWTKHQCFSSSSHPTPPNTLFSHLGVMTDTADKACGLSVLTQCEDVLSDGPISMFICSFAFIEWTIFSLLKFSLKNCSLCQRKDIKTFRISIKTSNCCYIYTGCGFG